MLSLSHVSAAQAETYYEQDDYYTQSGSEGLGSDQWFGRGAAALGLVGAVHKADFRHLLQGESPRGECLQGRRVDPQKHRAATDYTFSAPKSVSIAGLVQGDGRVIAAHDLAVRTALGILEARYSQTRISTPEGRRRVQTGNVAAAIFRHETSREQDPQLHSHCVVINATQLADGSWRSMSNEAILANQKLLGQIYQNELAYQLRHLGYGVKPLAHGQFELSGYDPELLGVFSTRTQQIAAYLADWSAQVELPLNAGQRKQATLRTRRRKQVIPREVLMQGWQAVIQVQNQTLPPIPGSDPTGMPSSMLEESLTELTRAGIEHGAERATVFRRGVVERFVLEHGLGQHGFQAIQRAIAATNELVQVDAVQDKVTTQSAIQRELATIRLMQHGLGQSEPIATVAEVERWLAQVPLLSSEQRQAIHRSATTLDPVMAWQGVAGAGKTFSLRVLRGLATAKGYSVRGFAPSAEAAMVLGREAGMVSDTVASLLSAPWEAESTAQSEIWVVDEAGLLGAQQAYDLLQRAAMQRARVILVGDTHQLSAVEAGNPLSSLLAAGMPTVMLTQSRRQKTAVLQEAVRWMVHGQVAQGVQVLARGGAIVEVASLEERRVQMVQAYLALSLEERRQTLMVATTNQERLALAQQLRQGLQTVGQLGVDRGRVMALRSRDLTAVQARYALNYRVGDVVVAHQDYRRLGLCRGEGYRVVQVDGAINRLVLETPGQDLIHVNPATCPGKSVYAVQELAIAVGDRLRWTRNQRVMGRRNGQLLTVERIEPTGQVWLVTDEGQRVGVDVHEHQYLDYGWVSTVYGCQGQTADRVLALVDGVIHREGLYVVASRARADLRLYTADLGELIRQAAVSGRQENPSDYGVLLQGGVGSEEPGAKVATQRQQYLRLWQYYGQGLEQLGLRRRDTRVARRAAAAGQQRRVIALMLVAGSEYVRRLDGQQGRAAARAYVNRVAELACRQQDLRRQRQVDLASE